MPDIFNLWNRYLPGDGSCEFDVTMANAPKINQGTPELIEACLKSLEIPNPSKHWDITPFRSQFYSDYPGREVWKDRWARGWEFKVWLDGPVEGLGGRLAEFPQNVGIVDKSWDGMSEDPRHDSTALVIAIFKDDVSRTQQFGRDLLEWSKQQGSRGRARTSVYSFGANRNQLRMWFFEISFPDWVPIGDKLKERCRELGGIVNRRDLDLLDR